MAGIAAPQPAAHVVVSDYRLPDNYVLSRDAAAELLPVMLADDALDVTLENAAAPPNVTRITRVARFEDVDLRTLERVNVWPRRIRQPDPPAALPSEWQGVGARGWRRLRRCWGRPPRARGPFTRR
jgi:hypothetical protein